MEQLMFTFPGGRRITNFQTLGAVATLTITVPSGKRWALIGGSIERDQAATLKCTITDAADQILIESDTEPAGTTRVQLAGLFKVVPQICEATDKIVLTWGAAQTTPEVSVIVLEVNI